jgi:hypothetical protein
MPTPTPTIFSFDLEEITDSTFIKNKDKNIPLDKYYYIILEKSKIINIIV